MRVRWYFNERSAGQSAGVSFPFLQTPQVLINRKEEKFVMERSVPNSNSTVLIEIIGFDGPLLVHLEARTAELLSLDTQPKSFAAK